MAKKSSSKNTPKKKKEVFATIGRLNFSYKQIITILIILGVGLFAASGTVFYRQIFTDPDRVLDDMLAKSLQTGSIQRQISFTTQQSSVDQTYYNTFSPNNATESILILKEGNYKAGQATEVTKQSIGVADKDFVRYKAISLPPGSEQKDFSKVLNVWGRLDKTDNGEVPGTLNESIFSIVPFANLPSAERNLVMAEADKVNLYKYTNTKLTYKNGRPTLSYEMAIKPESLLKVLNVYATVTGTGDKEQLNPEQYKDSQDINIQLEVDLLSRHVREIKFIGSSREETYGAYGLKRPIELPKESISVDELQSRLTQFQ